MVGAGPELDCPRKGWVGDFSGGSEKGWRRGPEWKFPKRGGGNGPQCNL